ENNIIKLIFPKPSEEQRIQLTSKIKQNAEEAKIGIRNIILPDLDETITHVIIIYSNIDEKYVLSRS
ncbi:MAG: hypothetical protein Q8830_04120, partial [Candidatus Phytoplasma australasiaticum]|nr:hypothetical protein [Candidatus Phytoplasma australasiaticum]